MKILVKTNVKKIGARGSESVPTNEAETALEIPNTTLAALGAFLTVILTVGSGFSGIIKDWAVGVPKERMEIELKEDNQQLTALRQALQSKTPQDRANSIKLLINAGLLKDKNGELLKQANDSNLLPLWESTPLPNAVPSIPSGASATTSTTSK